MKVLILAGGFGSRLSEETYKRPKPMVEVGGQPILWHIMKIYSSFGYNEFIILCGYKGYMIKEFFANYYRHRSDLTIDMVNNSTTYHKNHAEPWKVTLLDTGLHTMTGGRIKRARDYIGNQTFMLTYGDGVADIDIDALLAFHRSHGKAITVTSVQPEGRFGALKFSGQDRIESFREKAITEDSWINGGFFVCEPRVMDYISDDNTSFEGISLENLAKDNELFAYRHRGFWKPMDTLRDKNHLEKLLESGEAPWKKW